jgi:hypothetical protein
VGPVGPDLRDPAAGGLPRPPHPRGPRPVWDLGRPPGHRPAPPPRVDPQVTRGARDRLPRLGARWPSRLARRERGAVEHRRRGLAVAAGGLGAGGPPPVLAPGPGAVVASGPEVPGDGPPSRPVGGPGPPRACGAGAVEQPVEELARRGRGRSGTGLGLGDQVFAQGPGVVWEVGRGAWSCVQTTLDEPAQVTVRPFETTSQRLSGKKTLEIKAINRSDRLHLMDLG